MIGQNKKSYKVYSELLNKPFDSVEELEAAEAEVRKAEEEKKNAVEAAKAERMADVAKVQDAANAYLQKANANKEARAAMKKAEDEAYAAYRKELNNFATKHNGYHLTVTQNGDNVEFKVEDCHSNEIDGYFKEIAEQQKKIRDLFNSFWF